MRCYTVYRNGYTDFLDTALSAKNIWIGIFATCMGSWDGMMLNLHLVVSQPKSLTRYIEMPLDLEWWMDIIFQETDWRPDIIDGYMETPDEPGLGVNTELEKN